ncbi:ROK family transcriptional regulator [Actinoplanes sp. SE50]|uniref:ROK family transcriptional regulator n=1 Tax=unclassified Actinoplanes TaxID=2626549 RepID=UPI00023EC97A|nr:MULTISPECIES: ROK family transcriptional regulator [unclassified Actinoplanes]AEV84748.1 Putative xylose repressor [Actinoplanes sp. SE50/110]ATO83140.1 ROK family transcriptional regulator [Actinoplanes sp. SE50]SLM00547.1 ROK family protein [Actinoplanes sp. SE50/110]
MARRETSVAGPGSRALIVDVVRSAVSISRVELAERTGLTQPSISNIVRDLIGDGVIHETGSADSARGKPRRLLAITAASRFGIGFQLGPDTLTCVAIDLTGGVVGREVVPFDGADLPEQLTERFDDFMADLDLARDRIEGLAIVTPAVRPGDEATVPPWTEVRAVLAERLGIPVLVENDAAAAALGEFWSRRVSREQAFGSVYLSSGIGAGLVFGGALHRGASFDAGELGHMSIAYDGLPCPCGNRGCVERYASMVATVDAARAAGLALEQQSVFGAYDAIARAAVSGDPDAFAVVDQAAGYLSVAVTSMVNLLDLGRVVLTGPGMAIAGSIYARRLRETLARTAHARHRHEVVVELSAQPRDAAGIGAAALVVQASIAPGHTAGLPATNDA